MGFSARKKEVICMLEADTEARDMTWRSENGADRQPEGEYSIRFTFSRRCRDFRKSSRSTTGSRKRSGLSVGRKTTRKRARIARRHDKWCERARRVSNRIEQKMRDISQVERGKRAWPTKFQASVQSTQSPVTFAILFFFLSFFTFLGEISISRTMDSTDLSC